MNPPAPLAPQSAVEPATPGADVFSVFESVAEEPGMVSGSILAHERGLVLYWIGSPGDRARELIEDARASGLSVEVRRAFHSSEDAFAVAVDVEQALQDAGIEVSSAGAEATGSVVLLAGPVLSVDPDLQRRARALAAEVTGGAFEVAFLDHTEARFM